VNEPTPKPPELRPPQSPSDWDAYYDLRWRILRAPWGQPRGSERDSVEESAYHLMISDKSEAAIACGRFHFNSPTEAQVRFMAVREDKRGVGLGSAILRALEAEARRQGARQIVLNARQEAIPFYQGHGYQISGGADTMFEAVHHVRMSKSVR
jgi:predicted GNAT family N-acyltransferase